MKIRGLRLKCARVLAEGLRALVLMYGIETMVWAEMERLKIRAVQMHNLRGLFGYKMNVI